MSLYETRIILTFSAMTMVKVVLIIKNIDLDLTVCRYVGPTNSMLLYSLFINFTYYLVCCIQYLSYGTHGFPCIRRLESFIALTMKNFTRILKYA